jgi:hypothetical protein
MVSGARVRNLAKKQDAGMRGADDTRLKEGLGISEVLSVNY